MSHNSFQPPDNTPCYFSGSLYFKRGISRQFYIIAVITTALVFRAWMMSDAIITSIMLLCLG